MGTTPTVTWKTEAGLATIRMQREHGNAINAALVEDLILAVREVEADPSVHGALLAASGKIFCPGLDLRELVAYDRPALAAFLDRFSGCLVSLYGLSKPLVAAVSGPALAGGCILALTADRAILRRGAVVGLSELRVGVPFPFGVAQLLRASVHPSYLGEVALLGRNYTDEAAVAAGLVHELHGSEGFEAHCLARLEEFTSKSLVAFARTKAYLRARTIERIVSRESAHMDEWLDVWFSAPTQERIAGVVAELESKGR